MDSNAEQVLQTALNLSAEDRAQIAETLINSLDEKTAEEIEAAWAKEIERRIQEIDQDLVRLIPAEEVMREMRDRLHG